MSLTLPVALHRTYDQTTPNGNGGNAEQATLNKMAFDAAYAPIHTGMQRLKQQYPLEHSILLFMHTHLDEREEKKHRQRIEGEMQIYWNENLWDEVLQIPTLLKIPDLIKYNLSYAKSFQTNSHMHKSAISALLGVQETWYKPNRPSKWDHWFESLINFLAEEEDKATQYMDFYLNQVKERLAA